MDFLTGQYLIFANKKYEDIYDYFRSEHGIETAEMFLLCASIGFKGERRKSFLKDSKNKQFRSNYLRPIGKTSFYSMLLADDELGLEVEDFSEENKDKYSQYISRIEEYAEGGIEILIEEVFKSKFQDETLDRSYKWYMIDVLNFVSSLV